MKPIQIDDQPGTSIYVTSFQGKVCLAVNTDGSTVCSVRLSQDEAHSLSGLLVGQVLIDELRSDFVNPKRKAKTPRRKKKPA